MLQLVYKCDGKKFVENRNLIHKRRLHRSYKQHRTCCTSVKVEDKQKILPYAIANEAGNPIAPMLIMDRSIAQVRYCHINTVGKNVLRPKRPLSRSPIVNNVKPSKNWLPFPTVGTKGSPAAVSQTWCNDGSISFKLVGIDASRIGRASWRGIVVCDCELVETRIGLAGLS